MKESNASRTFFIALCFTLLTWLAFAIMMVIEISYSPTSCSSWTVIDQFITGETPAYHTIFQSPEGNITEKTSISIYYAYKKDDSAELCTTTGRYFGMHTYFLKETP